MTINGKRVLLVLAALTSAPRPAGAVGEQVGRIRGVVTDAASGQPLLEVVISARSPALIGEPRTLQSDDHGRFEILSLPPGTYTVELSYPGTVPVVRKALVRQGETVVLNVAYTPQTEGVETVAVTTRQSLTRPDSTHTGASLEAGSLNRLPTGRSYQNAAQQVPGVSGGANPNIKGGQAGQNRYLIDGIDVSDPITGTFSTNLTFDSIDSVEIVTGGTDAEYNALGGIINVITGGGGDSFHATAALYFNHDKLSASSNYGINLWEGEQSLNETPVGKNSSYEASVNLGGPIIKKKLWFGLTYQFIRTEASLIKGSPLGVPPYDIQHPSRVFLGHVIRGKLTFAPSSRHRIILSSNTDPASIDNTTQSNLLLGVAEQHQNQGGLFISGRWQWFATDHLTPEAQLGYVFTPLAIGPQADPRVSGDFDKTGCDKFSPINCTWDWNRPRRINRVDDSVWYQGPAYRTDNRYRLQLDAALAMRGAWHGQHNAKVGLQTQYLWRNRFQETPGGSVYEDFTTGVGLEQGLCDPATGIGCDRRTDFDPYDVTQTGYGLGFFIQDHWWTPLQWLTVNPGLRADLGRAFNRNGDEVATLFGLSPRLGFTADLTRDGRNILFGYYGRSTLPVALDIASNSDIAVVGATRVWQWDPATHDYTKKVSETGGEKGVVIDHDASIPRSDELTAGFRREFIADTVTSLEYSWKRISYQWDAIETNRIWDPSGTRVVGWADPTKEGLDVIKYTTPYAPRLYQGFILKSEGRPSPRWEYHASHTVSWTTIRSTLASNPRQQRFLQGWSTADLRHYLRLYGAYYLTANWNLGATFQFRTQGGDTLTKVFYNQQDNARINQRSPNGTTPSNPNDINGVSEFRPPPLTQLDLRLQYNVLPAANQNRLYVILDIFNVLNSRTATAVRSADLATFGQVLSRQAPLRAQLAVSWVY
jgi:hypothetical protein